MAFEGFPKETVAFLAGLSKHNDKEWFEAHRDDYEASFLAPGLAFVEAIRSKLAKLTPKASAERESMMRIYRDTRFAKDKRPYKDHLDLFFWCGKKKTWEAPGYFFRLTPTILMLGSGMHTFAPATLAKYRKAVLDAKKGPSLARVVTALAKGGYEIGGETYKRVPRGADEDHPRAALLKHGGLYATWEGKHPKELFGPKAIDFVVARFEATAPINAWLAGL